LIAEDFGQTRLQNTKFRLGLKTSSIVAVVAVVVVVVVVVILFGCRPNLTFSFNLRCKING